MSIHKNFVTYEIALKLKDLGFNESCLAAFRNDEYNDLITLTEDVLDGDFIIFTSGSNIKAPLWQQVIDWFREKFDYHVTYNVLESDGEVRYIFKGGEYQSRFKVLSKRKDFYEAREYAIINVIEKKLKN